MKIGRNDPCHCGSGKKYKRCHLALDEQRQDGAHEPSHAAPQPPAPEPSFKPTTDLLRELRHNTPKGERAEFDRLMARTKPIMAYLERREEIETASTTLEEHRAEFEKFLQDEKAILDRAHALFAEARFKPLWFTADDIRRGFEAVGYLAEFSDDDRVVAKLRAAILHVADRDRRGCLSMDLLLHLPHYVAAGRYLDGWLIQFCANQTVELDQEANPFLFEMFSHGHQAWTEEQIAGNDKMLREAGLDPTRLPSMTLGEVESWLRAQQADPASKARMEAIMEANPEQRALAAASLEQMESDSIKLLEREDFSAFLLPRQEVEPWQVALNRRLKDIWDQTPRLSSGAPPESTVTEVFSKTVLPVIGEMAKAIFTPERVRQLLSQLDNYRSQKLTADDKHTAGCAMGAIVSLEREPDPARNYFLNSLCYFSLRAPLCDNQPGP